MPLGGQSRAFRRLGAINWQVRPPFMAPAGDPTFPRMPGGVIMTLKPPGIRGIRMINARLSRFGRLTVRSSIVPIGAFLFVTASFHNTAAQSPQFVPAYPLYCQG